MYFVLQKCNVSAIQIHIIKKYITFKENNKKWKI